tara:strand:+ start:82 stop:405 length:324 start_codon:yes stop_codon:yes gene_type:complete
MLKHIIIFILLSFLTPQIVHAFTYDDSITNLENDSKKYQGDFIKSEEEDRGGKIKTLQKKAKQIIVTETKEIPQTENNSKNEEIHNYFLYSIIICIILLLFFTNRKA